MRREVDSSRKGHNSLVIPLKKTVANTGTTDAWPWQFRSDQYTHPQGHRTQKTTFVISLSVACVYVGVCSPFAVCATAKKPQSHFCRVTAVRGDLTASAPLP